MPPEDPTNDQLVSGYAEPILPNIKGGISGWGYQSLFDFEIQQGGMPGCLKRSNVSWSEEARKMGSWSVDRGPCERLGLLTTTYDEGMSNDFILDASLSSSIYKDGNVVRPPSVPVTMWKRLP